MVVYHDRTQKKCHKQIQRCELTIQMEGEKAKDFLPSCNPWTFTALAGILEITMINHHVNHQHLGKSWLVNLSEIRV